MKQRTKIKLIQMGLMALIATAQGCGLFGWLDREDEYRKSEGRPPLEVPPDLSDPVDDRSMAVPEQGSAGGPRVNSVEPPDLDNTPLPEAPKVELPRDDSGAPYLALEDTVESAWRRTGLALERTGFTIEERDEARRLFVVRYMPPVEKDEDGGFFDWLFGRDDDERTAPAGGFRYQVSIVGAGETESRITVLNDAGEPESGATAERILSLLAARLG